MLRHVVYASLLHFGVESANHNKRSERLFAALKEALMPTVMITGTNRGLGFEFVKQYAADGWRVFAACRHPTSADSLRLLAARKAWSRL